MLLQGKDTHRSVPADSRMRGARASSEEIVKSYTQSKLQCNSELGGQHRARVVLGDIEQLCSCKTSIVTLKSRFVVGFTIIHQKIFHFFSS
jgi:hypothetical protein